MPRHSMRSLAGALLVALLATAAAFTPAAEAKIKPKTVATPKKEAAEMVYITDTGKKYHSAGCRYLKSSSHAIPLDEAKKSYEACKVCKGDQCRSID